ncbi:hypothetical protein [Microbulbifer pacificus]|uniref:Cytochrome c domain-containing protein n=1 Tax=Microbulbifer pacificus TaxID=407164 RepID=A0AAU0MU53_9GAMM|nr:hypothetical protein [Microbulbifer pacificus]WOX04114.1 hypothetical protein R5R33_10200 [Microbulbifer pacificus]
MRASSFAALAATIISGPFFFGVNALAKEPAAETTNLGRLYLSNPAAVTPPQCYTKTENADRPASNPCYACHTNSQAPNFTNDLDLQLVYDFAEPARQNRWHNLFKDRSEYLASVSDKTILDYVREDNYRAQDGSIPLAQTLTQKLPAHWDGNRNGTWDGYVPDVGFDFDSEGFDRDGDGHLTGWRALAYTPFPGTFFPTNGSTDDVLIRLPAIYRNNESGKYSGEVYRVNLAIVEALIKRADVAIAAVDETILKVDLDKNGELATATKIAYDWAPREQRFMSYVGEARLAQQRQEAPLSAGSYPLGTEFLHSVRYLDVDSDGQVRMASRMKELRYARKVRWVNYFQHRELAADELKDAHDFPDRLEPVVGDIERGVSNRRGWRYSGFIEDAHGALRPQSFEELASCTGCHGAIGANVDGGFAMGRKLDAGDSFQRGWYHWTQKPLAGLREPLREDGRGEYAFYLQQVGNADEYRSNTEVRARFFAEDGSLQTAMLERLATDINILIMPSPRRALDLNKAYRAIVEEQSYREGRDAVLGPRDNLLREVAEGQETGVREVVSYR